MNQRVGHLTYSYEFPSRVEPEWKGSVERWYQLDPFAYGLTQAYWEWRPRLGGKNPDLIILASPDASTSTDWQFARSGASSPQKFVHTLPNIRSASLCQVMGWSGPLLCLQNDPTTIVSALREAAEMSAAGEQICQEIWMMTVLEERLPRRYDAHLFRFGTAAGSFEIFSGGLAPQSDDLYFKMWLKTQGDQAFSLGQGLFIKREKIE